MQRIDLFGFYRLGQYVHPASELRKPTLTISKITSADLFLRLLIAPPHEPMPLGISAIAAAEVIENHEHLAQRFATRITGSAINSGNDGFLDAALEQAERVVLDFEAVLEKELLATPEFLFLRKVHTTSPFCWSTRKWRLLHLYCHCYLNLRFATFEKPVSA